VKTEAGYALLMAVKAIALDDDNVQHLIIGLNRENIESLFARRCIHSSARDRAGADCNPPRLIPPPQASFLKLGLQGAEVYVGNRRA